ncbi:NAD(P)/FAD-dependent oxidoreductase [Kitasatospora sp. NPDC057965]|uniref:NAD(P)/FAD-dependent oxidoreductase n=1 Tax=Kitasatospora sp. NPDC057965 TaxID=3346291 RepID=UPI0036D86B44
MTPVQAPGSELREVIVIGSGPAAYTAALYTARAQLHPLVFEGTITAGGGLMTAAHVEDFPGFPVGVPGPELSDDLRAQAYRFGAELVSDDILATDLAGTVKTVTDTRGTVHRARTVIVATGSRPRRLGVPGEDELSGRGTYLSALCDGHAVRNRDAVVVGGGDGAMHEALLLARVARRVTVVHHRRRLRASRTAQAAALAHPAITFVWDSEITALHGSDALTGVRLRDIETGTERDLATSALFTAIGQEPRTEVFAGQLDRDTDGYLKVSAPSTRTSLPGVFAAGDVADPSYRQAVTAAASGCAAALDTERHLATLRDANDH